MNTFEKGINTEEDASFSNYCQMLCWPQKSQDLAPVLAAEAAEQKHPVHPVCNLPSPPENAVSSFLNDHLLGPPSVFKVPFHSESPEHSSHLSSWVLFISRPVPSLCVTDSSFNSGTNFLLPSSNSQSVFKVGTPTMSLDVDVCPRKPRHHPLLR